MFFLKPIITYLEFVFFSKEKKNANNGHSPTIIMFVTPKKKRVDKPEKFFFRYRYRLETHKRKRKQSKKRKRINESKSDNYSESH